MKEARTHEYARKTRTLQLYIIVQLMRANETMIGVWQQDRVGEYEKLVKIFIIDLSGTQLYFAHSLNTHKHTDTQICLIFFSRFIFLLLIFSCFVFIWLFYMFGPFVNWIYFE